MKTLLIQRVDRKEPTEEDKDQFKEFTDGAAIIKYYAIREYEPLIVNRGGVEYELLLEVIKPVIRWVQE